MEIPGDHKISGNRRIAVPIKIILAILLFLCLANWPYGYYQFVRFAALIGFGYLAHDADKRGKINELLIYAILGFMFQPFFKIAFGRVIWNVVDVAVGVALLISIFFKNDGGKKSLESNNLS